MKYLLNGVAIAAALVIAAPAWAQAPAMAPAKPAPAPAAMAPAAKTMPMAKQMHKRPMRMAKMHMGRRHMKMMSGGDASTEQLNRDELMRLQGGAPMMAPSAANAGAGQGGPRASGH